MERIVLKYQDALNALKTFQDIFKEPFSVLVRDATIQRFEYTFEAFWKFLREYLKEKEGIIANTPKEVFRAIFQAGFLTEEETIQFLEMTDSRNDTSHTYKEVVSQIIFQKTSGYATLMKSLLSKFEGKL